MEKSAQEVRARKKLTIDDPNDHSLYGFRNPSSTSSQSQKTHERQALIVMTRNYIKIWTNAMDSNGPFSLLVATREARTCPLRAIQFPTANSNGFYPHPPGQLAPHQEWAYPECGVVMLGELRSESLVYISGSIGDEQLN